MVYNSGTTTSRSSGFYVTGKGRIGTRAGRATRQTKLAEAAAPPSGPSLIGGFFGMALILYLFWALVTPLSGFAGPAVPPEVRPLLRGLSFALGALVIFLGWVRRHRAKISRFRERLAAWQNSWLCTRCGSVWSY